MKTNILSLLVFFTLLVSGVANAQYGNRNGLDRSIGSQERYSAPKKNKSFDFVKTSTDNLVKELSLDGFQEAIVKNIFEDYKNTSTSISEEEIPNELKYEKLKIANDKMETKILEVLTDNQKVKFAELKDKAQNKNKKDKKKKKSKKEEEVTETIEE